MAEQSDRLQSVPRRTRRNFLRGAVATVATALTVGSIPDNPPRESREEIPYTPDLQVYKDKFIAEGKEVILRGAVTNHYVFKTNKELPDVFRKDIDWLKQQGANFVVVQWNSGFLQDPSYITRLVADCEYAKAQGLRVELSLHSRGFKTQPDWEPQQIELVNDRIISDWETLLADPDIANRFAQSVDIFSPLSEPNYTTQRATLYWREWKPLALKATSAIRNKLQKENAVIAICGVDYGADAREALRDPIDVPNVAIETHPYNFFVNKPGMTGIGGYVDYKRFIQDMKKQQRLAFVGEMGLVDDFSYLDKQYKFFTDNNVSFAVYAINSSSDHPRVIKGLNGITKDGEMAVEAFQRPRKPQ